MATVNSTTYAAQITDPPTVSDDFRKGGVMCIPFTHTQDGLGLSGEIVNLVKLPAGRIRVLASSSIIFNSDFGSTSDTIDIGWQAYTDEGTTVAADANGLHDGQAATSAGSFVPANQTTDGTKLFESDTGVILRATMPDADIPDAATLKGYFLIVQG